MTFSAHDSRANKAIIAAAFVLCIPAMHTAHAVPTSPKRANQTKNGSKIKRSKRDSLLSRLEARWQKLPRKTRRNIAGGAVFCVAAAGGCATVYFMQRNTPSFVPSRTSPDTPGTAAAQGQVVPVTETNAPSTDASSVPGSPSKAGSLLPHTTSTASSIGQPDSVGPTGDDESLSSTELLQKKHDAEQRLLLNKQEAETTGSSKDKRSQCLKTHADNWQKLQKQQAKERQQLETALRKRQKQSAKKQGTEATSQAAAVPLNAMV